MDVTVLDIQRMSSEDGPGLRTTAFFKGCPLRCQWCHNPESLLFEPQLQWYSARCMACRACLRVCPNAALSENGGICIDRIKCKGCFVCRDVCPTGALEGKGSKIEPAQLVRELLKDRAYFGADGGVTLSGGEALAQQGSLEVLEGLKKSGVSVAVDTCGLIPRERLEGALALADIVLYDLKLADSELHKRFTGSDNGRILENFAVVCDWAKRGGRVWVRTPIIPDATDTRENIGAIGAIIREGGGVERWELCAFNNLCADKYQRLDMTWAYADAELIEPNKMRALLEAAMNTNACGDIRAVGALKREE